ncbi:hypothetical protein OnM2_015047 [Erysiphe neolycopersici]|uniref:Uncharacterized protein n=1 Tax=Erysiphe neolycopersici TaxID=212602 RepID=A0A420I583_9PEZI|nr:hypothetical protein OnM2_015047 [Erysiphe neolycopersici]
MTATAEEGEQVDYDGGDDDDDDDEEEENAIEIDHLVLMEQLAGRLDSKNSSPPAPLNSALLPFTYFLS